MSQTYKEIRPKLKTGDIVLFSGGGLISGMIKWFTKSKWSHVGVVIVDLEWDMVLLWESTTLSKIKTIHGNVKQGVAIRPLSERINEYDEVAIRHLEKPLTSEQEVCLSELRAELKGRNYEEDKIELFKSAYDFIGGHNEEDLSSVFCSELVAEYLQRVGFLSEEISSNEFTPADFGWSGFNVNLEGNSFSDLQYVVKGVEAKIIDDTFVEEAVEDNDD